MPGYDRKGNSVRNIIWSAAAKCITVLMPFVTRTFLIYGLGTEYLGMDGLYASILQVLNLAELGFSSAVVYSMYKPVAEGDERLVAALLNYFRRVYRIVGLAVLAGGLLLLPFLDSLVSGDVPDGVSLRGAYLIYLANAAVSYFLFAYRQSLLNAYQRNDVISKVSIATSVGLNAARILVLALSPNFYAYALALPLFTVANNVFVAAATSRLFPQYGAAALRAARLDARARKGIRRRVAGLMIQRVCAVSRDSFDSITISAFLGLTAVGLYSNYFAVMSGVLGIVGTIGPAIAASVGNSVAVEGTDKNFRDLRKLVFAYSLVSMVAVASLLSVFQGFMLLWMGPERMLPDSVAVLLCVYFYVRTMGDMRATYADAAGIWWEQRWRALFEAIANIALNLVLVQALGIPGVILATVLSLFLLNFCYGSQLLFKHYFKNGKAHVYYLDHALYAAVCVAVCALTYAIVGLIPLEGVPGLAVKLLAALAVSSLAVLGAFCRTQRFEEAKGLFASLRRRA